MHSKYDGIDSLWLSMSDENAAKVQRRKPEICAVRQPWKDPAVTIEEMVLDLRGSIIKWWSYYRRVFDADYTILEAVSDAVIGIQKAIAKDALAPSLGVLECKNCGHLIKLDGIPAGLIADREDPETRAELRRHIAMLREFRKDTTEQNEIYEKAEVGQCPPSRLISVECPCCQAKASKRQAKTIFSTHVWQFIRVEIQRGARLANGKRGTVSIDNPYGEAGSTISDSLAASVEHDDSTVPIEIMNIIHEQIGELSPSYRRILALWCGFGGLIDDVVQVEMQCRNAECRANKTHKGKFMVTVDYTLSKNYDICPHCGTEHLVPMNRKQTEIAGILGVSKQRVCSLVNKIKGTMAKVIPASKLYA